MNKFFFKFSYLILLIAFLFISCGKDDDPAGKEPERKEYSIGYYVGDFDANGKRNGTGAFTFHDGTTFTCEWKDDMPADEKCFLLLNLKDWYYWSNDIGVIDVADYASAEAMLETFKNSGDNLSRIAAPESEVPDLGKEAGFGMGVRWDVNDNLRVAWVYAGTPAGQAGIKRGWKILKINGSDVYAINSIDLTPKKENDNLQLLLDDESGNSQTVSLTSQTYSIPSVLYKNTYQLPGKKAGYLVLQTLLQANKDEITQNMTSLISDGIQELIIDLRYCSAAEPETMNSLAGIILPTSANGKVFMTAVCNDNHTPVTYTVSKSGSFNINRLFILTTATTAGMGEQFAINLKPYTEVIVIGDQTPGIVQYQTTAFAFNEKITHTLVTAEWQNEAGSGAFGGLIPDYLTFDDAEYGWGDENEEMLKNGLYYVKNGYFPVSVKTTQRLAKQRSLNFEFIFNTNAL